MIIIEFIELVNSCYSGFFDIPRMQPALLLCGIFPPPAPFTFMLPGQHGFRAGLASDAHESLFMELIIWDLVFMNIIPYLF